MHRTRRPSVGTVKRHAGGPILTRRIVCRFRRLGGAVFVLVVLLRRARTPSAARGVAFPLRGVQGARDRGAPPRARGASASGWSARAEDRRSSVPCFGEPAAAASELALVSSPGRRCFEERRFELP